MKRAKHWFGWSALLIATGGCLGGQTGQPTVGNCEGEAVAPNEAIAGVTPASFVAAFAGIHVASLAWETPGTASVDVLTLELGAAEPLGAYVDCEGTLGVNVNLVLRTRDHGVLEMRSAVLTGTRGQREHAELQVSGSRVRLDADLNSIDGEVRISGTLTASDTTLPAPTATFPTLDGSGGEGGGG